MFSDLHFKKFSHSLGQIHLTFPKQIGFVVFSVPVPLDHLEKKVHFGSLRERGTKILSVWLSVCVSEC